MLRNGSPRSQARPRYETESDLSNERQVISIFSEKFKCTFSKMPIRYGLDYAMSRDGKVRAFAEIKCRSSPVSQYDTYMLSLGKLVSAHNLRVATGLDCFLMVRWTDAVGYIKMDSGFSVAVGGRLDRNDWQDIEPVVHYPIDSFKIRALS